MASQRYETFCCDQVFEFVDDGMAGLAQEKDVRAAMNEARRAAELRNGQNQGRGTAVPREPSWALVPGSLAEAVYWYRQLTGLEEVTSPGAVAASLCNLGYCWRDDQRWADAESAFNESLLLHRQFGNRSGEGQTFRDLGHLYQAQGRWAESEVAFGQSLAIAREVGNRWTEASVLHSLGEVCAAQGQAEKAVELLEQALRIGQEIKDVRLVRRVSATLIRLGRPPEAQ
jgi:tetratricopeptide (TPR) repeat protein